MSQEFKDQTKLSLTSSSIFNSYSAENHLSFSTIIKLTDLSFIEACKDDLMKYLTRTFKKKGEEEKVVVETKRVNMPPLTLIFRVCENIESFLINKKPRGNTLTLYARNYPIKMQDIHDLIELLSILNETYKGLAKHFYPIRPFV